MGNRVPGERPRLSQIRPRLRRALRRVRFPGWPCTRTSGLVDVPRPPAGSDLRLRVVDRRSARRQGTWLMATTVPRYLNARLQPLRLRTLRARWRWRRSERRGGRCPKVTGYWRCRRPAARSLSDRIVRARWVGQGAVGRGRGRPGYADAVWAGSGTSNRATYAVDTGEQGGKALGWNGVAVPVETLRPRVTCVAGKSRAQATRR